MSNRRAVSRDFADLETTSHLFPLLLDRPTAVCEVNPNSCAGQVVHLLIVESQQTTKEHTVWPRIRLQGSFTDDGGIRTDFL